MILVFKLYILQNRQSWAKFRPGSSIHQNMYTFFAIRGAGGNFAQVLLNWQIETVNLSFKVCMHSTRKKRTAIQHHLLQYRRHTENIGTKTRHRKGNKVHMFGS